MPSFNMVHKNLNPEDIISEKFEKILTFFIALLLTEEKSPAITCAALPPPQIQTLIPSINVFSFILSSIKILDYPSKGGVMTRIIFVFPLYLFLNKYFDFINIK